MSKIPYVVLATRIDQLAVLVVKVHFSLLNHIRHFIVGNRRCALIITYMNIENLRKEMNLPVMKNIPNFVLDCRENK